MRVITESSNTTLPWGFKRAAVAAAVTTACTVALACSQTPTSPATPALGEASAAVISKGTNQTWEDFRARGWNCRTPNNGPVTVCSPPNQPLPTVAIPPAQPPADRPETVMLKRWRNGVFEANVLLIRPEIYNGQPCGSTGQSYIFVGVLGYFECAHIVGNSDS